MHLNVHGHFLGPHTVLCLLLTWVLRQPFLIFGRPPRIFLLAGFLCVE
jgi:hypothetical protein